MRLMAPTIACCSSAPPPVAGATAVVFLVALVIVGLFALKYPNLAFLLKNLLFTTLLILTPVISKGVAETAIPDNHTDVLVDGKRRIIRASVESIFFVLLISLFTWWITGQRMSWRAHGYISLLVLFIEVGAHLIEWHKGKILSRVRNKDLLSTFDNLRLSASELETMFKQEPVLYASIPFGILLGSVIGLIRGYAQGVTLMLSLKIILVVASAGLLFFLLRSFLRMASPIFVEGTVAQAQISTREPGVRDLFGAVNVQVPPPAKVKKAQEKQDLDLSVVVSDLRKVYLYNSVHNVILLAVFAALFSNSLGISVPLKWWIISSALLTFIATQLPYAFGQTLMHDHVLRRFEGVDRVDMKAKLKKYAPALPKSEIAGALIASNTVGGFLFFLVNEFLKGQTQ